MILVTGGAGYIGSHTVRELRERGVDVVVYDNLSTGHIESIGDANFVKGDLFDTDLLRKTMREYGVDSVIHFAAYSLVGESMVNPAKYYHNNVAGTLSLLDAMLEEGVKYLVFSSSAATYGDCGDGLITEDSPQNPTSVYGQTKLMMEQFERFSAQQAEDRHKVCCSPLFQCSGRTRFRGDWRGAQPRKSLDTFDFASSQWKEGVYQRLW